MASWRRPSWWQHVLLFACAALQWIVVLYSKGDFVCVTFSMVSPFFDGCVEFRSTWGNLVLGVDEWVKREELQHFYVVKWVAEFKSQDSFDCHVPKTECAMVNWFLELWCFEIALLLQSLDSRFTGFFHVSRQSVQSINFQGMKFSRSNLFACFKARSCEQANLVQNSPSLFLKRMRWRHRSERKQASSSSLIQSRSQFNRTLAIFRACQPSDLNLRYF